MRTPAACPIMRATVSEYNPAQFTRYRVRKRAAHVATVRAMDLGLDGARRRDRERVACPWVSDRIREQLRGAVRDVMSSSSHIVVVSNYLPPNGGGVEFVADALAREYAAAGHRVTVAGYDTCAGAGFTAPYQRVALGGWNGLERRSVPLPILGPRALLKLRRLVRHADAVHIHGLAYLSSFAALLSLRRATPNVVTEHVGIVDYDSAAMTRAQRLALAFGARLAAWRRSQVVVLNDRVAADVRAVAPRLEIRKLPNGVDLNQFRPPSGEERAALRARFKIDSPAVLVVARNARKKRLDLVVDVATAMPATRFVICGRGTETLAGVASNVRLLGEVDRATVAMLYQSCDALLLPSESEGLPLVVLEAMASGLPVVMGDDPDVARELPEGVITVRRNVDAVRAALDELLGPEAAPSIDARTAVAGFDWRAIAESYLRLLCDPTKPEAVGDRR